MERQVVIQVTDEVLDRMMRGPLVRAVARRAAINTGVVIVVTALLCYRKGVGVAGVAAWSLAAALVMVLLARIDYWRLRKAAMRPYLKLPDRGLTYRFTDDSLEIGSITSYSICRWKNVRRVRRDRHGWTFHLGANQFLVVPIEALDGELRDFIEQRLAATTARRAG
jgi:hypothetical protein